MGIGKSLVLRKLIYSTQQSIYHYRNSYFKYNEKLNIFVSALDPSNRFKKMNIMRSILKRIIEIIEQRPKDPSSQ